VNTNPAAEAFSPRMMDRAIGLSRQEAYSGSKPNLRRIPGEKIPMNPRIAPSGRYPGLARKPRATAKLKFGPGNACLGVSEKVRLQVRGEEGHTG
jgi:hypothetical protein